MQRWEQGLKWLGEDLHRWLSGEKNQHMTQSPETLTQSKDTPVYQNIINNYSNDTQRPVQKMKFGFMTIGKIILLTVLIGITIKVLLNPMILINGINTLKEVLHSI